MGNPERSYKKVEARKKLAAKILEEYLYRLQTGDTPLVALERVIEELHLFAMPNGEFSCPECGEEL